MDQGSMLGPWVCTNASTPQNDLRNPQRSQVEMDPVELFRLRCLREAEEKIRQGLLRMGSNVPEMTVGRQRDDRVSQESQSSYASAMEPPVVQRVPQEPVLLRAANNPGIQNPQNVVPVVNEPFVPKPPPGPPPPSPPR